MALGLRLFVRFFFFNDTATTEIYTLSLHDALPICWTGVKLPAAGGNGAASYRDEIGAGQSADRKSTRLNSSHLVISYAVFCLKKKNRNCNNRPDVLIFSSACSDPHHA